MIHRSVIIGCGAYLPERVVTNDELAQKLDTTDKWIRQRTGIEQRHIAQDDEKTSDLALSASIKAIEAEGIIVYDVD